MASTSTGINKEAWDYKNVPHQWLSPWGTSQLFPCFPVDASRLVNGSPLHIVHLPFNLMFLCFFSGQVQLEHETFKGEFFILSIFFFQFSWIYSSLVFKNSNFRVLSFLCRTQRSKYLMWSSNSLLFMEKIYSLVISPNCGSLLLGVWFVSLARYEYRIISLPFSSKCSMLSFYLLLWGSVHPVFRCLFKRNIP